MADTARPSYVSDGTARSDTARRLAYAGAWAFEDGDQARGLPLIEAAWQLGVADPVFYQDMMALTHLLRCPTERLMIATEARRRWPGAQSDSVHARAAVARQQAAPADLARPCPLRLRATAGAR